jgi:hypothetical protein
MRIRRKVIPLQAVIINLLATEKTGWLQLGKRQAAGRSLITGREHIEQMLKSDDVLASTHRP